MNSHEPMTFEAARAAGPVYVIGCDPGCEASALACVRLAGESAALISARYASNMLLGLGQTPQDLLGGPGVGEPLFFVYETCGCQGRAVGASVFETSAMGGELRRAFRPYASLYALTPSDWRYALCGVGNARTPAIYAEFRTWFPSTGGGADPLRGTTSAPGPLAALHAAGKGGNMEHVKDALGVALALDRVRYRRGHDPERYRRP